MRSQGYWLKVDYWLKIGKKMGFIFIRHVMEIMSSWASGMFWVKWFGVIPDAPMAGDHPSYPGGTRTVRAGYQEWTVPNGEHTEDIV
jgi:hypothetical protein